MALDKDDRAAVKEGNGRAVAYIRNLPSWCLALGQVLCAALMVCLMTVLPQPAFRHDVIWPTVQNALFIALSPVAWALCVAYFLWLAARRRAPLVQFFLGGRLWDPFARLTFGAYLVHPIILSFENSLEQDLHTFSLSRVVKDAIAITVAAYACALVLWLLVEAPCSKLFADCISAPLNAWAASTPPRGAAETPKQTPHPFLWTPLGILPQGDDAFAEEEAACVEAEEEDLEERCRAAPASPSPQSS